MMLPTTIICAMLATTPEAPTQPETGGLTATTPLTHQERAELAIKGTTQQAFGAPLVLSGAISMAVGMRHINRVILDDDSGLAGVALVSGMVQLVVGSVLVYCGRDNQALGLAQPPVQTTP